MVFQNDHSFITFGLVIITNLKVIMRKGAVQKMLQSRGLNESVWYDQL